MCNVVMNILYSIKYIRNLDSANQKGITMTNSNLMIIIVIIVYCEDVDLFQVHFFRGVTFGECITLLDGLKATSSSITSLNLFDTVRVGILLGDVGTAACLLGDLAGLLGDLGGRLGDLTGLLGDWGCLVLDLTKRLGDWVCLFDDFGVFFEELDSLLGDFDTLGGRVGVWSSTTVVDLRFDDKPVGCGLLSIGVDVLCFVVLRVFVTSKGSDPPTISSSGVFVISTWGFSTWNESDFQF